MTDITAETDTPVQPTEKDRDLVDAWLWERHCYVWGISCSGDHDASCYRDPAGHYSSTLRRARLIAGYNDGPPYWKNPRYQAWLTAVFAPEPWLDRLFGPQRPDLTALPARSSPIEKLFWAAHLRLALPELAGLVPQHPAGRYRIDFALPECRTGIELDGHATHSSPAAIARDRQRQRDLERAGWRIIRFGGQEVHRDAAECVRQAAILVRRRIEGGER